MAFSIFSKILSKTLKPNATIIFSRTYQNGIDPSARLMRLLRDPNARVSYAIDQLVKEGGIANHFSLFNVARNLRARKRFDQALQVYEWMSRNRPDKLSRSECAIQLGLISRVHGLEAAERFFESMDSKDKVPKTYGSLLFCYSLEGKVEKCISTLQKMKELGFASSVLDYNNVMSAYANIGQLDKVRDVLSQMKENGVRPNAYSYNIFIKYYGEKGDIDGVDKVVKEAESQPETIDCLTYATLGNIYLKAGQEQKAIDCLKKCEANDKEGRFYGCMISHYASLGKKDEMMRLWAVAKGKSKRPVNMQYINMLTCLIKLEEYEECEKLIKEWEMSCHYYDFRVPNTLIMAYSREGLIEKAEAVVHGIIERRKIVDPTSWKIVAVGYEKKQNMEKAYECMKSALALQAENRLWKLEPSVVSGLLSWLGDNRTIEDTEEFVRLLEGVVPKNREMYHALLKAYIRGGKSVDEVVKRMKDDKMDEDEETHRILSSIH